MKKIGIVTYHAAINYGAVLQAYALQRALKEAFPGFEIKVIDFQTAKQIKADAIFRCGHSNIIKRFIIGMLKIECCIPLWLRKRRFHAFVKSEFNLTKKYSSESGFLNNPPLMDVYVSGSDQVFSPKNYYRRAYYLSFNKQTSRKVAYAPSFGRSEFTPDVEQLLRDDILDFDRLSCREDVGAEFLSKVINDDVPVVVDPVFLLDKIKWAELAVQPNIRAKYIFVYDLNGGKALIKIAKKIADKTGFKIVCQTQRACAFYKIDKTLHSTGPREFVGLIQNAQYVVTDSFHGTAFSILFEKPFYSYIATPHSSSRIYALNESLGLKGRIIDNEEEGDFKYEDIKWVDCRRKLTSLIGASKVYMKSMIQD